MQNLNTANQDIKIQYFCDYWRDFTTYIEDKKNKRYYFKNLEQDSINHILYNPKELFKEFINEIEIKNLSNKDNKKFFMENVKNLFNLKIEALNFLESSLKIIIQQFNQKDDFSYLLHTLKFAMSEMANFRLGKQCVNELAIILTDDTNLQQNKENIKHLVHFIVFELQDKGFSHKKINKIINDIKEFIDSLTNKDRILAINNYFEQETISETISARFIFRVKGIKGKLNIKTNDIEIYNPLKKTIIANECYDETFGLQDSQKASQGLRYNIAIRVDLIPNDIDSAKYEAIRKFHIFFDSIMSRHFYIKVRLRLDTTQYYIIDDDNNVIGSSYSINDEFMDYQNAEFIENIDLNEEYLKYYEILTTPQDDLIYIDKQIGQSFNLEKKCIGSSKL